MDDIENRYNNLIKKREKIVSRLEVLQKHMVVKEYNNLKAENKDLLKQINQLSTLLEYNYYDNCNHILINTDKSSESDYYGCIKCGLKNEVLETYGTNKPVMFSYLANHKSYSNFRNARKINDYCDLELAQAIYQKINNVYPNIDDDLLIEYFENSLRHIRNIEVNKEREISRSKRLELNANFSKWK